MNGAAGGVSGRPSIQPYQSVDVRQTPEATTDIHKSRNPEPSMRLDQTFQEALLPEQSITKDISLPPPPFDSSDALYQFTMSGDPDLDYWVRSVEGPGYPLYSVNSNELTNSPHTDLTYFSSRGEINDWQLGNMISAGSVPETGSCTAISTVEPPMHHQISDRLGKRQIAEDGCLRYYGATSNVHILHNATEFLTEPHVRSVETHGKEAISQANLEWSGDLKYEEHLLDLFFAWHNPLFNVVDKCCFYRARAIYATGNRTLFYSPCLSNAMYVLPTRSCFRTGSNANGLASLLHLFSDLQSLAQYWKYQQNSLRRAQKST